MAQSAAMPLSPCRGLISAFKTCLLGYTHTHSLSLSLSLGHARAPSLISRAHTHTHTHTQTHTLTLSLARAPSLLSLFCSLLPPLPAPNCVFQVQVGDSSCEYTQWLAESALICSVPAKGAEPLSNDIVMTVALYHMGTSSSGTCLIVSLSLSLSLSLSIYIYLPLLLSLSPALAVFLSLSLQNSPNPPSPSLSLFRSMWDMYSIVPKPDSEISECSLFVRRRADSRGVQEHRHRTWDKASEFARCRQCRHHLAWRQF